MKPTELDPLIKAFVKTLEEAATSTQFECQRVTTDSFDIEPGTVVENNKPWVGFDGRTYTHEEFTDVVRVVHYGII